MHHQIREVCDRLEVFTFQNRVLLNLTAGERTPLGNILSYMYYSTDIHELLNRDERWGYPHNGGSHTFHFNGSAGDALAFLELLHDAALEKFKDPETREVASQLMFVSQEILSRRKQ